MLGGLDIGPEVEVKPRPIGPLAWRRQGPAHGHDLPNMRDDLGIVDHGGGDIGLRAHYKQRDLSGMGQYGIGDESAGRSFTTAVSRPIRPAINWDLGPASQLYDLLRLGVGLVLSVVAP